MATLSSSRDHRGHLRKWHRNDAIQTGLIMAAVALAAAVTGGAIAYRQGLDALDAQLADRFSFSSHVLSAEIERLRHLPRVLAEDPRLHEVLRRPQDPAALDVANDHLQRLREISDADEVYLINAQGVTLAASNWDEPGSFVGADYSFRPYFRQGMALGEAHYYAIGVTTNRPGAFLSARIEGDVTGLSVVKMDLSAIDAAWARAGEITFVSDEAGMTFLASNPQWRFRPLVALSPEARSRLEREQRYSTIDLQSVAPLGIDRASFRADPTGPNLRLFHGKVPATDWQMTVALPLQPVQAKALLFAALSATAAALSVMALVIRKQRAQILRLNRIEAQRLERAVSERTAALAREIEERRRTEIELRRTQEGLVHAAKLAVLGRMSSAIVHEVGQSLSALDNNLAAAELHGQKHDHDRLAPALNRARQMLRRLQGVVVRLRSFGARQSLVPLGPVDPLPVLRTALEIIAPRIRELDVEIRVPNGALPLLHADGPRLEQVVTNVLLNAVEACAGIAAPRVITVAITPLPSGIEISVTDTGAGLPAEIGEDLGQPFVSAKAEGLGLGLYLVQNLLEQMEGRITFAPNPQGRGTRVGLILQAAPHNQAAQEAR